MSFIPEDTPQQEENGLNDLLSLKIKETFEDLYLLIANILYMSSFYKIYGNEGGDKKWYCVELLVLLFYWQAGSLLKAWRHQQQLAPVPGRSYPQRRPRRSSRLLIVTWPTLG